SRFKLSILKTYYVRFLSLFFSLPAPPPTLPYTLSLHDALPISTFAWTSTAFPMLTGTLVTAAGFLPVGFAKSSAGEYAGGILARSEEHTSELQSRSDLVCRLLLEKKKKNRNNKDTTIPMSTAVM